MSELESWLEAAREGGFPAPTRADRWQPLRAGVVNLWEFSAVEYWYANGWVQLIGRNETGKSSLMALTTLIPWLADTASTNIDTLGRSGKKFRYYVEPTGQDGDRRPTEASTHRGWLWVEYGRLRDGVPAFFTTLLFAEARSASPTVSLLWCTAEGPRVRDGLDLAPGQAVVHPRELPATGLIAHPSAAAYKEHVATHLLGSTVDRLLAAGKMLRSTRTPKLGAELNVAFVQEHLRTALPELDRAEVDALAAGWDQLDQLRADLEATRRAVSGVERFRTSAWLPWVRAQLRQRADEATRARTEFDRVTRAERAAEQAVEQLTADQDARTADLEAARSDEEAAATAREALRSSARYLDAQSRVDDLERHRAEAARLRGHAESREGEVARARGVEDNAAAELADHHGRATDALADAEKARDHLAQAAARAEVPLPSGEVDLALLGQRLHERQRGVKQAGRLVQEARRADEAAGRQEDAAVEAEAASAQAREEADSAWQDAEAERASLVTRVSGWAAAVEPRPDPAVVDALVDGLPSAVSGGAVPGPTLRELVRQAWFDPARAGWERRRGEAERRRSEAEARASELGGRIADLEAAGVPAYEPPQAWARRARPERSEAGAPLWALLDPRAGVSPGELAHLEAALAAQGLLDAWVVPDGVFRSERDGDDTVLAMVEAPEQPSASRLAEKLAVASEAGGLAGPAAALLERVRLVSADEPLPPTGMAVAGDGRWRFGALAGRAGARQPQAEWIGESARAARRRRELAELAASREEALGAARHADEVGRAAESRIDALTSALAAAPDDEGLRSRLLLASERDRVAEVAAAKAGRLASSAGELRAQADRAAASLHEYCTDARLPRDAEGLTAFLVAIVQAQGAADTLRAQLDAARAAQAGAEGARTRLLGRVAERERAETAHREAARASAAEDATVATLESAMGADDAEVLRELDRLTVAQAAAKAERERLEIDLRRLGQRLGEADATLRNAQRRRGEATQQRDAAFASFRRLIDHGLADEAGIELPAAHATAIDRVREQVVATRGLVSVPNWPSEETAQQTHVQGLYQRLVGAVHDARAELEAHGRSLQLVTGDEGLPRIEVQVDATGVPHAPRQAAARLAQIHEELGATYTARVQETLDELLGSTFMEHLRRRIGDTDVLVQGINATLAKHPVVTTNTSLRIVTEADGEANRLMLEALRGSALMNPEAAAHVREHLKVRVEAAKQSAASAGEADWRDRLVETLDYRRWFEVHLQKKVGSSGTWRPLTSQTFAEMSGGARAVMLMLPLVATLAALYSDMDGAPRPLWLDEAFDGLDSANRATVLALFGDFDLDVLLAGPNRLVNVRTVPAAAIYQVVRAPAPFPGADLTLELWAGGDLNVVELPTTLPQAPGPAAPTEALV